MSRLIDIVRTTALPQICIAHELDYCGVSQEITNSIRSQNQITIRDLECILQDTEVPVDSCESLAFYLRSHELDLETDDELVKALSLGYKDHPTRMIQSRVQTIVYLLLNKKNPAINEQLERKEALLHVDSLLSEQRINLQTENETETFGVDEPWHERKNRALEEVGFAGDTELVELHHNVAKEELQAFERMSEDGKFTFAQFIEFLQFCDCANKTVLEPEFTLVCKKAADGITRTIMGSSPRFYRTLERYAQEYMEQNTDPEDMILQAQQEEDLGSEYGFIRQHNAMGLVHSINTTDVVSPYLQLYLQYKHRHVLHSTTITEDDT